MLTLTNGSPRPLTAALLAACMGLSMSACAQTAEVAEAPAEEATVAVKTEKTEKTDAPKQEAEAEEEKSAEEKAKEAAQKEIAKLQQEASLRSARLAAELAPMNEKKQRIEAELSWMRTLQQQAEAMVNDKHAKIQLEQKKAEFENQIKIANLMREMSLMQQQLQKTQVQLQVDALDQQIENEKLTADNAMLAAKASVLQAQLNYINTERSAASVVKEPMKYPKQPMKGKTLTISDRRIPMNDGIYSGVADYVTERIHYYNNLDSEAPIFLVIDRNPGGSVMEGYRIVTAMQNSKAPVHVVVKQYAASMAAVITTLAVESYAYPNAIILHHQMSSSMRGNLTQQKEWLEEGFEWAKRLADPVAEKMGVDYDKFTELMYENNSDGDWAEFADKAQKLKWVNHVVEEIRETALVTAPVEPAIPMLFFFEDGTPMDPNSDAAKQAAKSAAATPRGFTQHELFNSPTKLKTKTDGNGNTYTELPALGPYDFYFLHDPKGHYRIAE